MCETQVVIRVVDECAESLCTRLPPRNDPQKNERDYSEHRDGKLGPILVGRSEHSAEDHHNEPHAHEPLTQRRHQSLGWIWAVLSVGHERKRRTTPTPHHIDQVGHGCARSIDAHPSAPLTVGEPGIGPVPERPTNNI